MGMRPPWTFVQGPSPVVAVALHDGHDLRPEIEPLMGVDDADRRREEDPFTGWLTGIAGNRVIAHRSRFEFDLNRPSDEAVALDPSHSWGLEIWDDEPSPSIVGRSRFLHAAFYSSLREMLDAVKARHGRFVVLDLHSYNHRRGGPDARPDDPEANPDVNVGTGSLDRARWGHLVDRFMSELAAHPLGLDVRENVKFKGRYLAQWVHSEYADEGCCLALEFKKTFMDEWTGEADKDRLAALADALSATLPGIEEELFR
jgi:N-formylglutamate deformylase